ncbi:hypothetical protein [Aquamicrobium terrae]
MPATAVHGKTKKEQIDIAVFLQRLASLAKMEQKRYIFVKITGMSGLH